MGPHHDAARPYEPAEERDGVRHGTLDSPAAPRGMDFYRRLHALGDGPVDADEEHPPQAEAFAGRRVARTADAPGPARAVARRNPDLEDEWGCFPVPGRTAGRPGAVLTGGSDLVVPANTDDRDGAVEVVAALTGARWNTEPARTTDHVPGKAELAGSVAGRRGPRPRRPAPHAAGRPPPPPGGARPRRTTRPGRT